MEFQDKVVILTGAGTGIGAELSKLLLSANAKVVLAGRRADKLASVLASSAHPENGHCVETDVSQHAHLQRLVEGARERFGRLDVLVNNAAVGLAGGQSDLTPEEVEYAIRVNLVAPIWLTQLALPLLLEAPEAMVVNVSSMSGLVALPYQSVYSASKAGIAAFGEALRRELRQTPVRVLTVFPGAMDTEMISLGMRQAVASMPRSMAFDLMPASTAAARVLAAMRGERARAMVGNAKEKLLAGLAKWLPSVVDKAGDKLGAHIHTTMLESNKWVRERRALPDTAK